MEYEKNKPRPGVKPIVHPPGISVTNTNNKKKVPVKENKNKVNVR